MSQVLQDIEEIKQLKHRYWRLLDCGDFDAMRECFVEDASISFIGGSYRFELQGREQFLEILRNVISGDFVSSHMGVQPEIRLTSPTEAQGTWTLFDDSMDFRQMVRTRGHAICKDRYAKRDGTWRIAHTGYTRVHEVVEPIRERPNITAHLLGGIGPQRVAGEPGPHAKGPSSK